ncbi:hypothetical protein P6B95_07000 [Streptomyces atratus]|uniref:hypothetical protein n=1 Tax=Streptomyces atratus TaxID=1893 RepID=UPI001E5C6891|nr:hypothetical protein [Streptomyces atratus]WPW27167.1 hypothetical protein P6B95_07000 [Streptomyces atratus]
MLSAMICSTTAVLPLGLERRRGGVGEERVVVPDREQLALLADDGGFGQVKDPAHDQPGRDPLAFLAAGEGGVGGYLGDLGVRDELAGLRVGHRGGDLLPRGVGDAVDGPFDGGVHPGGEGEAAAGPAAGGDDTGVVELRVRAQDAHAGAAGLDGGGQRLATTGQSAGDFPAGDGVFAVATAAVEGRPVAVTGGDDVLGAGVGPCHP